MKRLLTTILILFCLASLTACGNNQSNNNTSSSETSVNADAQQSTTEAVSSADSDDKALTNDKTLISELPENTEGSGKNTIVIYFSATGTTKGVAERIADVTNADLFEIVPAEPYTSADLDWNDKNSRTTIEMNDQNARPEIADDTVSFDGYSTIYIGYPIWWGDAPRIMSTFVEAHDFDGLTVIPFCTSGGSGIGRSGSNLASLAGSGNWLDGDRLDAGISEEELGTWINGLN